MLMERKKFTILRESQARGMEPSVKPFQLSLVDENLSFENQKYPNNPLPG